MRDITVTQFSGGIGTVADNSPWSALKTPLPTQYHSFFDDFDRYVAGDWTITTTEAGAGSASQALTDGDGGLLLITNDAADDDRVFYQKKGESFKFAVGKKLFFEARFKISDATQSDFVMGLQITDTTPLDVTDGVFFIKSDGAATVTLRVEKDNTATASGTVATMANDTFVRLGFYYNGVDAVFAIVDGAAVERLAVTNLPDDEDLTISFGIQNGEAVAKTMTLDYIWAAKER